ncbi:MAG: transglycosylase SLT domain-containing protein [Shimia sp.]
MVRVFLFLTAVLCATGALANRADDLRAAMALKDQGRWEEALSRAGQAGPVARDIIEWHKLRASQGSFAEAIAFLDRRADWPGLPLLRQRSERTIPEAASAAQVIGFFATQAPRTGTGTLRLIEAFRTSGDPAMARAEAIRAWTTLELGQDIEQRLLELYSDDLERFHWERANTLLFAGKLNAAERLIPRLSEGQQALVRARAALRRDQSGFDALIEAVPTEYANDPGLAYERFLWRAEKGRGAEAADLMLATTELGEAERWGNLRRRYARQAMRDGDDQRAYLLASRHGLTEGRHFADLEWLAGYVALRKFSNPSAALVHFEAMEAAVDTPISLARAAYWQGRAHEAAGDEARAMEDYRRGGQHQTAFYGLLAAEKAVMPLDPLLTGRENFPDWRYAPFTRNSNFEAAILLLAADQLNLGERFLTHMTESLDRQQVGQLGELVTEMGQPHLQVMIAKRAVQYGHVLEGPYFPLHPLANAAGQIPPEMALAIARRESEFDPVVSSGVGARGLMQLMPATAEEVAGGLGLPYDGRRLFTDPAYNARLGIEYLRQLYVQFGESPIQVAAAYNAGPSRPLRWMDRYGDPRQGEIDVVDWIEHIPFRETRNYVMRVSESLPVYRARLTGQVAPLEFTKLITGALPDPATAPPLPARQPAVSLRPVQRPDGLTAALEEG